MSSFSGFRSLMLASVATAAAMVATTAWAQSKTFDVPAQPASTGVAEFARQADVQILISAKDAEGHRTNELHGAYSVQDGLNRLLAGSGLVVRRTPTGALVVVNETATDSSSPTAVQEIVVTGTHIRGSAPAGSSLTTYGREDIDQSGAATLEDFARIVPENFASTDQLTNNNLTSQFSTTHTEPGVNTFNGAAFNIHGLGPTATLTLLNGQRLAPEGLDASFSDISSIPLSAIERIEVLSDGASAIYGSDAVAGVVNLVTRKDFTGAESSVRYGGATDGGAGEFTASELLGKSWDTGSFFINYEYDHQDGLNASQRHYIGPQGGPDSLIPEGDRNSLFANASQTLGESTEISGFILYSDHKTESYLSESEPLESFLQRDRDADSSKQLTANFYIKQKLVSDWSANFSANYSKGWQTNNAADEFSFGPFSENISLANEVNPSELDVTAEADGTLFSAPGGKAKAALGASFRQETFNDNSTEVVSGFVDQLDNIRGAERRVGSVFGELSIPFVGQDNELPLVKRFELSLAGRYDHYSDFGSTTNPKVGLLWEPADGIRFRGTYGTSFRAPLLSQIYTPIEYGEQYLADGTGSTIGILETGGNLKLRPETSRSFTAGADIRPAEGASLSLTYFNTSFSNQIEIPPQSLANFNLADPLLAPFITRDPALSVVTALYDSPYFLFDSTGTGPAGVTAIVDDRVQNLASTTVSGIDLNGSYQRPLSTGKITAAMWAEYLIGNQIRVAPGAPAANLLNEFGEPPRFKGRASVSWSDGRFTTSASLNYVNAYKNNLFNPYEDIDSWTTFDLYFGYKFGAVDGLTTLRNVRLALSVLNVLDARPPFVNLPSNDTLGGNPIPYDAANASPLGRVISLQISKRW